MRFYVALQAPRLVLQLSARPLEGVVHGKINIGVAFVVAGRMYDVDFLILRQRQVDVDLIRTLPVMAAGGLYDNTAGGNAPEPILQLRDVFDDFLAQAMDGNLSLEINLDRRFHYPPPITVSPNAGNTISARMSGAPPNIQFLIIKIASTALQILI
jgi:hypothetical protein